LSHVAAQEFHSHPPTIEHSRQSVLQAFQQSLIKESLKYTERVSHEVKLINQPTPSTFYEGIFIQKEDIKYLAGELLTHKFFHQLLRSGR